MKNLTPIKLVFITFISSLFAISMAMASPPVLTGGPDDEDHEHQQLDPEGNPVGLCAERAALGTAVASGARRFGLLAVASDAATPTPPCGMCRQALSEFGMELKIVSTSRDGVCVSWRLGDLLPAHFELQDRSGEGADG